MELLEGPLRAVQVAGEQRAGEFLERPQVGVVPGKRVMGHGFRKGRRILLQAGEGLARGAEVTRHERAVERAIISVGPPITAPVARLRAGGAHGGVRDEL